MWPWKTQRPSWFSSRGSTYSFSVWMLSALKCSSRRIAFAWKLAASYNSCTVWLGREQGWVTFQFLWLGRKRFRSFHMSFAAGPFYMAFSQSCSLVVQLVKNLSPLQETGVQSLGQEDPLEEGMATHSGILAWRTPRTEEPGGLQSMELQRVRHDWVINIFTVTLYTPQIPCGSII